MSKRALIVTAVILVAWATLVLSTLPFFVGDDDKVVLGGAVPNTWDVAPFGVTPTVLADPWISIPARSADGAVFGLVQSGAGGALVKLDEATGQVLWRTAIDPLPAGFVRTEGWRVKELFPALPLTLAGDGVVLLASGREWVLVASADGALRKRGSFPEQVPPVSVVGGICRVASGFWIAIEDGRDGGVMLSAAGELAGVRSDRPAECPTAGDRADAQVMSPLQNAHATTEEYPTEQCGRYNKSSRRRVGHEYCSDKRSDGGPERTVMLHISDPLFRDGEAWRIVERPAGLSQGEAAFNARIVGFELAWPHAFFDMVDVRGVTEENRPSAESFEPKRVETREEAIEVVASIARDGALVWARSIRAPFVRATGDYFDDLVQTRSLLLASHPDSPVRNLYIFKPGLLLAVDQATGAPKFQVGAALSLPGHAPAQ